jgi:hypothetical protein
MTNNQPIVLDFIAKKYESGELDDDDLVAIIKLNEPYLNPIALLDNGMTQQFPYKQKAVYALKVLKDKNFKKYVAIFNLKFWK